MPLLEAFLALALTMLSLAMVATLLVEFWHRFFQIRCEDLKRMLEEFYEGELQRQIDKQLPGRKEKLEDKTEFIAKMIRNPLGPESEDDLLKRLKDPPPPPKWWRFWTWQWHKELNRLPTEDLFIRLASTGIGKEVKQKADEQIEEFVDALTISYEEIGKSATDLFKRHARFISYFAGLIVAFGLNVNAITVFDMYLRDPQVRTKAIAQAETLIPRFENRVDKSESVFKDKTEMEEYKKSLREEISALEESGVVIGYSWDVLPGSVWKKEKNQTSKQPAADDNQASDNKKEQKKRTPGEKILSLLLWFLGVLGTGLLIGLGGPFWFDVVRKLSEVLQVVRGGSAAPTAAGRPAPAQIASPSETMKSTFKKAGGKPSEN